MQECLEFADKNFALILNNLLVSDLDSIEKQLLILYKYLLEHGPKTQSSSQFYKQYIKMKTVSSTPFLTSQTVDLLKIATLPVLEQGEPQR